MKSSLTTEHCNMFIALTSYLYSLAFPKPLLEYTPLEQTEAENSALWINGENMVESTLSPGMDTRM